MSRIRPIGPGELVTRHPNVAFAGLAAAGTLVLAPLLTQPLYAFALAAALIAAAIAWRTVAIPLALGGVPPLIDAVVGSNPLPKGGFTLLLSAWIAAAIAFAVFRGRHAVSTRTVLAVPVIASVALLGLMLLRLGSSLDPAYGSTKVQLYIADVLVFLAGAIVAGSRRADLRVFLVALFAINALGALVFLANLVGGHASAAVGGRFALSAQEYPIELGRDSAVGLLLAIYFVLVGRRESLRLLAAAAALPLAISLVAAGSRGPVLAFAIALVTLLALSASTRTVRRRLTVVAALLVAAALVVPLVVPGSVIGRALSVIVGSASGLSSNGRSSLWATALDSFNHHPLLGIGTGSFAGLGTGLDYPHNILLEAATELGLLGAVAIVAVIAGFAGSLREAWRAPGADQLLVSVLVALFVNALVNANFSGAFQDNSSVWITGGLALGLSGISRTADSTAWP